MVGNNSLTNGQAGQIITVPDPTIDWPSIPDPGMPDFPSVSDQDEAFHVQD
jgi:hypothetical protein